MNRREAFEFYIKLRDSGMLEDFIMKSPKVMTETEKELFYYHDGQVFFNTFAGELDHYYNPIVHDQEIDDNIFDSLMRYKTLQDLTEEEKKALGI